jgi:DNA repair protein RadC
MMSGQFGFGTSGSSPGLSSAAMFERRVNYRVREVRFSVVRESVSDPRDLSTPAAVVDLVSKLGDAMIPDDAREHFIVLLLNAQNRLVAFHRVSSGTLSGTLVQPREVFGPALRTMGVASIVLVHNHPSGDPTPSREDLRLTRQLVDAGRLLDMPVHDHVIVGTGLDSAAWVSFADRGLLS